MSTDLVLGTAGHIDHGKSSLILALTGTDPDRLAEEKQRGITIELGFAKLTLPDNTTLGVVDVPGHERFVRQMISGATGIDIALLCIAADDGIMPQTEEHLAVLELLGIPSCVVALTKTDLVDAEWLALMKNEVRAFLAKSPYKNAEIVAVSSRTGEGLDELKTALQNTAHKTLRTKREGLLRLPVDRVFTIKGAGTVITGTLWSGEAYPGCEVEVLPQDVRSRIRSVQIHGTDVQSAVAGHRVALNLSGLSTKEIRPGDFLATPGCIKTTDRFDADFSYVGKKPLKSGARVHVSHGTKEIIGRVLLMGNRESITTGEHCYAQVRLDEELPVSWLDRFVVRSYSPVHVIGGGVVLRAHPRRSTALSPEKMALLDALRAGDATKSATAAFALTSLPVSAHELAETLDADEASCVAALNTLAQDGRAVKISDAYFASPQTAQKLRAKIENTLLAFHTENPSANGMSTDALRRKVAPRSSASAFDAILADAIRAGVAESSDGQISHPQVSKRTQSTRDDAARKLLDALEAAGTTPPSLGELFASCEVDTFVGQQALKALEKQGRICGVTKDLFFSSAVLKKFEDAVRARLAAGEGATAAELRDTLGVSRKYAIPLLEYFDDRGLTRRSGDVRFLVVR